jgi:hypothetical protein
MFVVTDHDGAVFACWLEVIENEIRWLFVSSNRAEYFGPVYAGERSPEALRALVGAWWEPALDTV